ncbi:DNA methyltransferase [Desulfosudis oleivorans]|uniref:DNA methyltransferase n=1 Tax=Desulfosudis oleivorans TaxID=181663 RepID=UPI00030694CB|nr:DNA methyltransferase [Desulfosudis oleivorans]
MDPHKIPDVLAQDFFGKLFSTKYQLIPNLNDLYELELAFYEQQVLSDEELLRNSAYFARVCNNFTRHFLICTGDSLKLADHSSSRLKSFFERNLFRTGYSTHGLFPYRGKFHPQMIKGLINIMGLKPGDTVLDPMMGSGTVLVEASLMGINSIGIDASPFCRFMAQTKIDALTVPLSRAQKTLNNYKEVFNYFSERVGKPVAGIRACKRKSQKNVMSVMEPVAEYVIKEDRSRLTKQQKETSDTYNFLLLAYLDSVGYSERSSRRSPIEQFKAILERYLFVVEKIQKGLIDTGLELSATTAMEGDARDLPLDNKTVDGIIFSPPYSFAIDYLGNDAFHLNYLGVEMDNLRNSMIGLRGKKLSEKFELYREDMEQVLSECSRVLRPARLCTIIVGTNNNQLGKALGVDPNKVQGIHEILVQIGKKYGFRLIKMMSRPIIGISNTMRLEYIAILQRS